MKIFVFLITLWIHLTALAQPKTLFEGYFKVLAGDQHIGFVVHRYSFDEKAKQFRSTYYLKTNQIGGNITESLNALADDKFQPIAYQFTQTIGDKIKIIDATFNGLAMQATLSNGQVSNKITRTFPQGSFLSTFLGYLMLQKGMITDKHYQYSGIAEEDAVAHKGNAYISKDLVNVNGMKLFKILNIFKDTKFSSLVNDKGEVYSTHSPVQKISTELVSSANEATNGIDVNSQHLVKLFGGVPTGGVHSFATLSNFNSSKFDTLAPSNVNQGKKSFPAGQGVMIKGGKTSGDQPAKEPTQNK